MTSDKLERKVRGRRGRQRDNNLTAPKIIQRPFEKLIRSYPPVEIVSDDQLENIHQASLKLLSETGIDVLDVDARAIMKLAGADVKNGDMSVRFDPDLNL